MTTKLTIKTNNDIPLVISWSNSKNLKKWIAKQRTRSGRLLSMPDEIFFAEYQSWLQWYWSVIENMLDQNLQQPISIIDIGSGIGIIDLFLSLKFPQANFFLIDQNTDDAINGNLFGSNHPFYNSWEPTVDAIESNNFDRDRFQFLIPDNNWPEQANLITSHFSWCWHYNLNTYVDQVYSSLRDNGLLVLTVRFTEHENVVERLNDRFGPAVDFLHFKKDYQIDTEKQIFDVPGPYYGGLGIWRKIK